MLIADCGFGDSPLNSGAEKLALDGPTLLVDIGFDPKCQYAVNGSTFKSDITQVPALIDTGAALSCIDNELARSLNLPLVDRRVFLSLAGECELNAYLAHIAIPSLSFFQHGIFFGVPLFKRPPFFRALLGRTFLRGMVLVYDGPTGSVRIARQPSAAKSPHAGVAPQQDKAGPEDVTRR